MQLHGGGGDGGGAFGVGQQRAGDEEERVQVCNWKRRRSMTGVLVPQKPRRAAS
jgi:hypothetical protein